MDRRRLLRDSAALGLLGLGGCVTQTDVAPLTASGFSPRRIAPILARKDRLFDITVCLRPFRAAGPRLDVEQVGDARVVHNYGHGGSGWSLSWGSGTIAVKRAMASSPREIAVVGCGALGLTSAILAQAAGAQVTIYARDLLPDTRSARATGRWTPDSRIALKSAAAPGFPALWEEMARTSFKTYRSYLGLPGNPVEWSDSYVLTDLSPEEEGRGQTPDPLGFAEYRSAIRDLTPRQEVLAPGATPFPTRHVRRSSQLIFNIADYGHTLMADFRAAGGRIERREFQSLSDLATLREKVVINCPGYGARALCRDDSIIPVRGQIGWLIPQPEVDYGFFYEGVSVVSRRDGIVVQAVDGGDIRGFKDDNETPDRAESEAAVDKIAEVFARSRTA